MSLLVVTQDPSNSLRFPCIVAFVQIPEINEKTKKSPLLRKNNNRMTSLISATVPSLFVSWHSVKLTTVAAKASVKMLAAA